MEVGAGSIVEISVSVCMGGSGYLGVGVCILCMCGCVCRLFMMHVACISHRIKLQ